MPQMSVMDGTHNFCGMVTDWTPGMSSNLSNKVLNISLLFRGLSLLTFYQEVGDNKE